MMKNVHHTPTANTGAAAPRLTLQKFEPSSIRRPKKTNLATKKRNNAIGAFDFIAEGEKITPGSVNLSAICHIKLFITKINTVVQRLS
jgi:hypothetical protein